MGSILSSLQIMIFPVHGNMETDSNLVEWYNEEGGTWDVCDHIEFFNGIALHTDLNFISENNLLLFIKKQDFYEKK